MNRRTNFEDVGDFHERMGLPRATGAEPHAPTLLGADAFRYRVNFMFEELREFIEAHAAGDLVGCADALADLVYVALGTAHFMGLPFDEVWAEVQRSNMEKRPWREGDPVKPRASATAFEVVKPAGWTPPDVAGVVRARFLALAGRERASAPMISEDDPWREDLAGS